MKGKIEWESILEQTASVVKPELKEYQSWGGGKMRTNVVAGGQK